MHEAKENTDRTLATGESWAFELTNLQLLFGDEKTTIPLPPGAPPGSLPGFLLNRIPFSINGREWTLMDLTFGQRPLLRSETTGCALLSARLATAALKQDSPASLEEIVDAICMLLSFAVCRDVAAVQYAKMTAEGQVSGFTTRSTKVHLFSEGGSPIIDNTNQGDLRSFLETAYPIVAAK